MPFTSRSERFLARLIVGVFVGLLPVQPAQAVDWDYTGYLAASVQALESERSVSGDSRSNNESPGFGEPRLTLEGELDLTEYRDGWTGFGEVTGRMGEGSDVRIRRVYLKRSLPGFGDEVRLGRVEHQILPTRRGRTVGARNEDNWLVGNGAVDFVSVQPGLSYKASGGSYEAGLVLTAGDSGSGTHFTTDQASLTGWARWDLTYQLSVGAGYHRSSYDDHAPAITTSSDSSPYNLEETADVIDWGKGLDVRDLTVYQVGASYLKGIREAQGRIGLVEFGDRQFWHGTVSTRYRFTPATAVAYRASGFKARRSSDSPGSNRRVGLVRHQAGIVHDYRLDVSFRLEYVYQSVDRGLEDPTTGPAIANDFNGVVGEVSLRF